MYDSVLAEIHDRWFDSIPLAAARHVTRLAGSGRKLRFTDLGCGSGVFLEQVQALSLQSSGIDVSPDMIARARTRVPGGAFQVSGILDAELPRADVISAVGEILSYALSIAPDPYVALREFLARTHAALETGGLFLFDVLGDEHDYCGQFFHDEQDWTVHATVTRERERINRHIVSFIRRGPHFQKSTEDHVLTLLDPRQLDLLLDATGFSATRISRYSDLDLLPGRVGFVCRKRGQS